MKMINKATGEAVYYNPKRRRVAPVLGNQMPPLLCHSAVHFVLKAVPLQVGFRLFLRSVLCGIGGQEIRLDPEAIPQPGASLMDVAPVWGNQTPPLLCHSAVHFVLKAVPLQVGFRLSLLGEDAGFFLDMGDCWCGASQSEDSGEVF